MLLHGSSLPMVRDSRSLHRVLYASNGYLRALRGKVGRRILSAGIHRQSRKGTPCASTAGVFRQRLGSGLSESSDQSDDLLQQSYSLCCQADDAHPARIVFMSLHGDDSPDGARGGTRPVGSTRSESLFDCVKRRGPRRGPKRFTAPSWRGLPSPWPCRAWPQGSL